ncbi:hypothetical protein BDV26DRAFT_283507 [Aspergillus bertholletiae]|uniref:DUF6590 domain-containing protein n=1 Tax=Aspergillus bertholletiae TaxID=1226010 RepID=A0A5N7AZX5_9EURO|nr:hypothetical protein BDV26DRAFT_283507 [Aspergillus bertholletiae]
MPSNQDQGRESTHRRHSGAPSFPREGRDLNNQVSATREATHPGNYYTLEQSPFQPQSAHANISHPGHIPPYSSSHGIGSGRGSYFGSPPHPQGTMHAPSNTTSGPSPSYTRGTTGYTSDANTMSVFAVVWHEGMGNTAPFNGHTRSVATRSVASDREWVNIGIDRSRFDTPIYTDIRRMVVFKEQAQCAWCFPVHTYGRQGVAKESVDPTKHAVIYMEGGQPQYGRNEPRMTKEPIEVTPSENEKLHAMSRLNFGKIYTVEHHQRVLPVGKISENSLAKFLSYARRETEVGY